MKGELKVWCSAEIREGWVEKARPQGSGKNLTASEHMELKRLTMEREILKKAKAFFARENH
ncbi:MAG: hypothetical protein HQM11_09080 [SAR324 cluster bacterium]|nr:hypothetical protein [SAR324 cluster bacterium]